MAEEVTVGDLVFEQDYDVDGDPQVTVRKASDLEGWVTFVQCPENELEWAELRNKCYPLNGRDIPPPIGQWIVFEYVGKEGASLDLGEDRSEIGFSHLEIVAIASVVNMAYRFGSLKPSGEKQKHVTH